MSQQKVTKVATLQIIYLRLQREHVFRAIHFEITAHPPTIEQAPTIRRLKSLWWKLVNTSV